MSNGNHHLYYKGCLHVNLGSFWFSFFICSGRIALGAKWQRSLRAEYPTNSDAKSTDESLPGSTNKIHQPPHFILAENITTFTALCPWTAEEYSIHHCCEQTSMCYKTSQSCRVPHLFCPQCDSLSLHYHNISVNRLINSYDYDIRHIGSASTSKLWHNNTTAIKQLTKSAAAATKCSSEQSLMHMFNDQLIRQLYHRPPVIYRLCW